MKYAIERGRLVVTARSSVHDTKTVWDRVSGTAEADPADLATGASLAVAVDMTSFDAGDFLKNRKLRKDLELERHGPARFALAGLDDVQVATYGSPPMQTSGDLRRAIGGGAAGGFTARARGQLVWRGRSLDVVAAGSGRIDAAGFTASARFELDVTRLGVTPPRFLMFKVEDTVLVEVELVGRATAPDHL
jgi:hypothetical protein